MYRANMEDIDQIVGIYLRLTEDCKVIVKELLSESADEARRTGYKPLVDFANDLMRFYVEDVRRYLLQQFDDWCMGDAGFRSLVTVQVAKRKEAQMRSSLEEMFRVGFEELCLDASAPAIDEKDFAVLVDSCLARCVERLEQAYQAAQSRMRSMGESNDAAALVEDIVNTTGQSLIDVFFDAKAQVGEGCPTFSIGVKGSRGALTGGSTVLDHIAPTKYFDVLLDL